MNVDLVSYNGISKYLKDSILSNEQVFMKPRGCVYSPYPRYAIIAVEKYGSGHTYEQFLDPGSGSLP